MFNEAEMREVMNRIDASLKHGGLWLVTDFVEDKLWHRIFLFLMYQFFWLLGAIQNTRLFDWRLTFGSMNFNCTQQTSFFGKFITSCMYRKLTN
jgi:hypothetical protein